MCRVQEKYIHLPKLRHRWPRDLWLKSRQIFPLKELELWEWFSIIFLRQEKIYVLIMKVYKNIKSEKCEFKGKAFPLEK